LTAEGAETAVVLSQRVAGPGLVPGRPLLSPWYRLIDDGDRLLLEWGQVVVDLEGAAVRRFLPALLPLLDGTRSIDELSDVLGEAARPAIESTLETLVRNGLLTEGPEARPRVHATANALAAAHDVSPSTIAERLNAAAIGVISDSPSGAAIARLLLAAGVGEVRRLAFGDQVGGVDLAVVAPAGGDLPRLSDWNRAALACGWSWLPVRPFDGRFAAVGPLIVPDASCCYECLLLRRAANLEYGADLLAIESVPLAATCDPAFEALVVGLAAHIALRFVAAHDSTLPGVLHAVESNPISITEHAVLRVPRCPTCSPVARVAPPIPWHAAEAA
jgi:bacteriocin biosynthesis cyclodehydratase domain-containing protein